jgi:hypothetical protein
MFSGNPPMSVETTLHYFWDYAQQVHFPHQSTSKQQGNVMLLESALKDLVIIFSFVYEISSLNIMYLM